VQSPEVREGLVAMLGALDGFQVVGEADSYDEVVEFARRLRPQLALIDQDLSGHGGWWAIQALRTEELVDVIVALGRRADGLLAQLAGAHAYVQIGCAPRDLLSVLELAMTA
jgi:two-component system, NarL family, invasion response regulator UvrY